jgi:hypothetical protein
MWPERHTEVGWQPQGLVQVRVVEDVPEQIYCFAMTALSITECETRKNWRHRRLSTGRGRTDGAFVGCQGDHKPITVRKMRRTRSLVSEQPVGASVNYAEGRTTGKIWQAMSG